MNVKAECFRLSMLRRIQMKKSNLIFAGICLLAATQNADAAALPSGTLDDSSSIVIAKAVKLGRGKTLSTSFKGNMAGKTNVSGEGSGGGGGSVTPSTPNTPDTPE